MSRLRGVVKWIVLFAALAVALSLVVSVIGGLWLHGQLAASLPRLDGELKLAGLSAPASVERDDSGVPTIRATNRSDVARVTGFVHAQDRFFQMDLLRRGAAGELAELVGPAMLGVDRQRRLHAMRPLARRMLDRIGERDRGILESYVDGVNAGLADLDGSPPEYLLLRQEPDPWRLEDTLLAVQAMYFELQDPAGRRESDLGLMHDLLPRALVEFLVPAGTPWDAPISGPAFETPPVPDARLFDLRRAEPARNPRRAPTAAPAIQDLVAGSNAWAISGDHAAGGAALLANDMHLRLSVPNVWYRASLVWSDQATGREHRVTGVTLPGAPPVVAGSNGAISWGFTNSQGDWSDLVVIELDPQDRDRYLVPGGSRAFEHRAERILVHGGAEEHLDVLWTLWGPIIDQDHRGRPRALRWVAHDEDSVNLGLLEMERASGLDEAMEIASITRIPTQNCIVADAAGRIGWTLMGPMPRRNGFDGQLPSSWADGSRSWDRWLAPAEYPRIVDPEIGRLWSANNRAVDGPMLRAIGDGGYDLGARAGQIRDDLLALERATAQDMLAIQLDHRALFLERWRTLMLEALTPAAIETDARRGELRRVVERGWTGHASADSTGYAAVSVFREVLARMVFSALTAPCLEADRDFDYRRVAQWEGPLWRLVTERPSHMLDPRHASWNDQLLAAADATVVRVMMRDGRSSDEGPASWGELNALRMGHPLSVAVPWLSRWLDFPAAPLPGDVHMPRVQRPWFGASERMVVSPGREQKGIFHMPGGQSGHPLSEYYRKGHEAWLGGEPTPFLPGPTVHRLEFRKPGVSERKPD